MSKREQFLSDVMCAAFEGGINYWAVARNVERADGTFDYLSFDVRDAEDEKATWHKVDFAAIERGIKAIVQMPVEICKDYRGMIATGCATNDARDIDAGCADCIVQVACFGEIVFG